MIDIQKMFDDAVSAGRAKEFAESDQLSLGEIISKCEAIAEKGHKISDGEISVVFDFGYLHPVSIDSWRGIYKELALGFSNKGNPMKLSAFIEMLKDAIDKTFEGYKGGDYTMSRHTPVWVANYGNSGSTAVIDVIDAEYQVVIVTGYREY